MAAYLDLNANENRDKNGGLPEASFSPLFCLHRLSMPQNGTAAALEGCLFLESIST